MGKYFCDELRKAVNCPLGIDVYSYIASQLLDKTYYQCTEFDINHRPNPEGKANRQQIKLMIVDIFIYRRPDTMMFINNEPTLELLMFKKFPKLFDLLDIDDWSEYD